jgi:hypothetical protein
MRLLKPEGRSSPFPPVGSPALLQIHAALQAALDRRDEQRLTQRERIHLAQELRKAVARIEP